LCWYHRQRDNSLQHFSELGFETLGAGYYDRDAGGYQYDSGAAIYLGLKAGVGFYF
jgi:hypothetical protein